MIKSKLHSAKTITLQAIQDSNISNDDYVSINYEANTYKKLKRKQMKIT